jgi:hypothetical protein
MADDVCSGCRAPVRAVITEGGILRELNPNPCDDGNHTIITTPRGHIRAHVVTGTELPQGPTYKIHVCPPRPMPGGPCAVCGLPMDRQLAELEKWTTHPCCDPDQGIKNARHAASRYKRRKT